jgi:hypothetical protein
MGSGDGTGPFLNPEHLHILIFIKFPIIYILKNPLCDSIKGGKRWLNLDQFR